MDWSGAGVRDDAVNFGEATGDHERLVGVEFRQLDRVRGRCHRSYRRPGTGRDHNNPQKWRESTHLHRGLSRLSV